MIDFSAARMEETARIHQAWWDGTLLRPLIKLEIHKGYTGPALLSQANCTDLSVPAEKIAEDYDAYFSTVEFAGDSFPMINFDAFGPGVLAAMSGAMLDNSSGRVWFWPREKKDISDIHIKYDPESTYARRIKEIYRACLAMWHGSVVLGMPDLGGVMDVIATFRGTEDLLVDMIEAPEEVDRLVLEAEKAWREAYDDMESVLMPENGYYTSWSGLLSKERAYIDQCDLSYMIGGSMFRRFVLPTIRRDCDCMTNVIYHLDGIGELEHLDDVLSIEKLKAVQWVQGDGKPGPNSWRHIYSRILCAGKRVMITGNTDECLENAKLFGAGVYLNCGCDVKDADRYLARIAEMGL